MYQNGLNDTKEKKNKKLHYGEIQRLFTKDTRHLTPAIVKSIKIYIQSNLYSSNTDGSFTMVNSNSFLSPYEILPIAQENKY